MKRKLEITFYKCLVEKYIGTKNMKKLEKSKSQKNINEKKITISKV